jgi:hypothetical protein
LTRVSKQMEVTIVARCAMSEINKISEVLKQQVQEGILSFRIAANTLESRKVYRRGRVAQLGEHLLCKQGVTGSIPVTSTNFTKHFAL